MQLQLSTITLYDIPPRVGDEPRIIGRLNKRGRQLVEKQEPTERWHEPLPKNFQIKSLTRIVRDLHRYGQQEAMQQQLRALALDFRDLSTAAPNSLISRPRMAHWHRDGNFNFIIGSAEQRYNTEAVDQNDYTGSIPDLFENLNSDDNALAAFLANGGKLCQPGPYEIMEMTARTLHRSSPHFRENTGRWSFIQLNY